jgi:HlyD family secretion protein
MIKHMNWKLTGLLVVGVIAVGASAAYWLANRTAAPSYETTPATQGDVSTTITASGSVNPVVIVSVGTYVSGTIQTLSCDYNTRVRKGQLCAKIDPKPYQIVVDQAQAETEVAKAQLVKDQANVAYTKVSHERMDRLYAEGLASHDAADAALNAYQQAVAMTGLDTAQLAQKAAALKAAQINLRYTDIVSPVEGTVVSRNVTAGQTVAASFQTPTLFLIAADLTKMQVDTNVSESDIGGAVVGADASFTVDAFPRQTFHGRVTQVRQAPVSVQNVITYDAVITVDNPDLLLKPGMTATARIVTGQAPNVLRIPLQALRFTPTASARPAAAKPATRGQRTIWVQRAGHLVPISVTIGAVGDTFAEVRQGDLKPGDAVVTSEASAKAPHAPPSRALKL